MKGTTNYVVCSVLVAVGSLWLISCKGSTSESPTGNLDDQLSTPDVEPSRDTVLAAVDADSTLLDVSTADEVVASVDSSTNADVAPAKDEHTSDTKELGDDGCPVWVPVDEPDYDKPPQPASSEALCSLELPCPEGETCTATFYMLESNPTGTCHRECFHPQSDFASELGCDSSEYCILLRRCLSDQPDPDCDVETGRGLQGIGLCGPKNRTRGGPGGSWDATACPCEHPYLSEEDKAACEAGAQ